MMLGEHVDDIIVAGSDVDCGALVRFVRMSLPTSISEELTYDAEFVFERDWDKGTLDLS